MDQNENLYSTLLYHRTTLIIFRFFFSLRFAFVTFENESDCASAFKAHTQIGGEKVTVSYAFAKADKQQKATSADSNKNQGKKPSTPTENTDKKQPPKSGLFRI